MTACLDVFDYAAQPKAAIACPLCGADVPSQPLTDRYGYQVGVSGCVVCEMTYLNPRLTRESYDHFYREAYRPLANAYAWPVTLPDTSHEGFARGHMIGYQMRGVPVARLLDVGGGVGAVASGVAEAVQCADVTVIDPNERELIRARGRGCHTIQGLVETMTPATPRWDLIISTLTADHWLDPLAALRWMRGALTPGGRLWIDIIDVPEFRRLRPDAPWLKIDHPLYWTPRSFQRALALSGWVPKREWTIRGNHSRRSYLCEGVT